MATATITRQQESGYERMVRLAAKARKEGVQLLHNSRTGLYVATSGTQQGTRYTVTPHSCECKGHARFGYCKHVAALQTALGWITRPEEETPVPAPIGCHHCDGRGYWITARNLGRGQYERHDLPCPHCHGTGQDADADRMVA